MQKLKKKENKEIMKCTLFYNIILNIHQFIYLACIPDFMSNYFILRVTRRNYLIVCSRTQYEKLR